MYRLAHISDLHFGKLNRRVADALLAELQAVAPALVVVSGDLVQRPSRRSLTEAAAYLRALPEPTLVIAGNHDLPVFNLWRRFRDPFGRFRALVTEALAPRHVDADVAVLGLCSAKAVVFDFARGRIDADQRAAAERFFAEQPPDRLRILTLHHPVRPPPERPHTPLVFGAERLAETIRRCRIDLVLSGHLHRSFVRGLDDGAVGAGARSLSPEGPTAGHPTLICHAGTATSTRLRTEPNGYIVYDLERRTDGIRLLVRVRGWSGAAFEDRQILPFHRTDRGWTPVPDAAWMIAS